MCKTLRKTGNASSLLNEYFQQTPLHTLGGADLSVKGLLSSLPINNIEEDWLFDVTSKKILILWQGIKVF